MPSTLGGTEINGDPDTWLRLPGIQTVNHARWFEPSNEYMSGSAPGMEGKNFTWVVDTKGGVAVNFEL